MRLAGLAVVVTGLAVVVGLVLVGVVVVVLALAAAVGRRRRRKGERRRSDDRDDPLRHALILLIWLAVLPVASTHGRARGWAVRKGAQKTSGRGERSEE